MGDFRLAEVLRGQLQNAGKNVSNLDTSDSPQQIEYIDIGLLDGDPRNRRDLRGLEDERLERVYALPLFVEGIDSAPVTVVAKIMG